ncbi:MAG: hypothetical protein C4K60_06620 [Ideonella sp. MAG2]|nr:MAG: hypothetical protein C4K60_06620 [Ideonella sp. MAG2]
MRVHDAINPSAEQVAACIALSSAAAVDTAVKAARAALPAFSQTSLAERCALMTRMLEEYAKCYDDIAAAISIEMGASEALAKGAQAWIGMAHLQTGLAALKDYRLEASPTPASTSGAKPTPAWPVGRPSGGTSSKPHEYPVYKG